MKAAATVATLALAAVLAGCGGGGDPARVAAGDPGPAEAEAFVAAIYDVYVGPTPGWISLNDDAALLRYFEPGLAALIAADAAAAAALDSVPTLNGDPFVGAQEWSIPDYRQQITPTAGGAVARVEFANYGQPEVVLLDLVPVDGAWRIADIDWGYDSLVGILTNGLNDGTS